LQFNREDAKIAKIII